MLCLGSRWAGTALKTYLCWGASLWLVLIADSSYLGILEVLLIASAFYKNGFSYGLGRQVQEFNRILRILSLSSWCRGPRSCPRPVAWTILDRCLTLCGWLYAVSSSFSLLRLHRHCSLQLGLLGGLGPSWWFASFSEGDTGQNQWIFCLIIVFTH